MNGLIGIINLNSTVFVRSISKDELTNSGMQTEFELDKDFDGYKEF